MTPILELTVAAKNDLAQACVWYDESRIGLGNDFFHSVEDTLARIVNHPSGYVLLHGNYRRALVRRFSYAVYFRIKTDRIIVSAILHTSRQPRVWKSRISH